MSDKATRSGRRKRKNKLTPEQLQKKSQREARFVQRRKQGQHYLSCNIAVVPGIVITQLDIQLTSDSQFDTDAKETLIALGVLPPELTRNHSRAEVDAAVTLFVTQCIVRAGIWPGYNPADEKT